LKSTFKYGILIIALVCISATLQKEKLPYFFPDIPKQNNVIIDSNYAEIGRYLFYDPILSKDLDRSCASCHKQENAFADDRRFSIGIEKKEIKRNTLPLFNLAWYYGYFWDGRASTLKSQIREPIHDKHELNASWHLIEERLKESDLYRGLVEKKLPDTPIDSNLVIEALSQFESTLISDGSKYDKVLLGNDHFNADEYAGFLLVNEKTKGNCLECHTSDANALGTIGRFSNNGLDMAETADDFPDKGVGGISGKGSDMGKFKIPSFRNLVFTAPYMHDGRFNTLEEVVDFYADSVKSNYSIDPKMSAHLGSKNLNKKERAQIVAFLKTMSDSSFVIDQRFSNPF
jgi:cytochrome c peroxidase